MTTLVLRFPGGRYAATPWAGTGDDIEIPPSPWRLLRALYATWRTRVPELDEATVHGLLAELAVPPRFHVPPHVPGRAVSGAATVLLPADAEFAVEWPGRLAAPHHVALGRIAEAMPYLGRAESRCAGSVVPSWSPRGHDRWEPLDVADAISDRGKITSVLAAALPLDMETLLARPAEVRQAGLRFPAGTRLLAYQRHPAAPAGPVTAVRLDVVGRRPPEAETVAVTDLLRRAAIAHLGTLRGAKDRTMIGGRAADESVDRDQHAHTTFLPLLEAGVVSGLLAWTPGGLPDDEIKALTSVTRLSTGRLNLRVRLRTSAPGTVGSLAPALVTTSRTWTSATPYAPSRYAKPKADPVAHLHDDLTRELGYRGLPEPATVDIMDRSWQEWHRHRPSAARSSPQGRPRPAAFVRMRFDEPVAGPLALGHLSHFGLGLFAPEG